MIVAEMGLREVLEDGKWKIKRGGRGLRNEEEKDLLELERKRG